VEERRPLVEVVSAVLGAPVELVRPLRGGAHAVLAGEEMVVHAHSR